MLRSLALLALVPLGCLLSGCSKGTSVRMEGQTMATAWRVTIDHLDSARAASVRSQIQQRLDALEAIFSNWRKDSAVSQWNAARSTDLQPVPRELAEVAALALRMSQETGGALDVTIAPLIDLWGFGPRPRSEKIPDDAAIHAAMEHCGWQKLEVRLNPPMLRKSDPGLTINLSTLVEGYAADEIARLLTGMGHQRILVDVGGAIVARGRPWNIAIQQPGAETGEAVSTVQLQDEAVTTAGTYRKNFTMLGKCWAHILDPKTGRPVDHNLVSVSVFAPSAAVADGYDTGLLVLGPVKGREVADRLKLKAVFITQPSR